MAAPQGSSWDVPCAICGASCAKGSDMYDCMTCDYDRCRTCNSETQVALASTLVVPTPMTASKPPTEPIAYQLSIGDAVEVHSYWLKDYNGNYGKVVRIIGDAVSVQLSQVNMSFPFSNLRKLEESELADDTEELLIEIFSLTNVFSVRCKASETISAMQTKLANVSGVPVDEQELTTLSGEPLRTSSGGLVRSLCKVSTEMNATVCLVLTRKLRPPSPPPSPPTSEEPWTERACDRDYLDPDSDNDWGRGRW